MANFAFLTFYDKICLGMRILSSTVKAAGHTSHIILFKDEASKYVFFDNKKEKVNYECYVNGFIKGTHYDVDPWTATEVNHLKSLVKKIKPDVLCISTRSFWTELGKSLVESIREVIPEIPIVAGGWGPSLEPEKYLTYCDYVCFGEGEGAILDIGDAIDQGKDFRGIKNIVYKDGKKIIHNPPRAPIKRIDEIPFPDFSLESTYLISNNIIIPAREYYNEKMYDIFLGRGCPMNCSYCMSGKWKNLYQTHEGLQYPKVRWRSPERCIEELVIAKARGAQFIRFKDEVFPFHRKWIERFLKLYKKRINLPFFAYLAAEFHKPEILDLLYDAGFRTCGLGIQTASNDILNNIYNRPSIGDKFIKLADALERKQINKSYDVLGYNPFETAEDMGKTFQFLASLPIARISVFKLNYFPEAPISKMIRDDKPQAENENVYRWYAILFCMTGISPRMRSLAVFLEKHKICKNAPVWIQLLLTPYVIKEKYSAWIGKRKYGSMSLTLPSMKKLISSQ